MKLIEDYVWVILTKDNKLIAKGVPRSRYLIPVDSTIDTKRIITYATEGKAIRGCSGLYGSQGYKVPDDLKVVKVKLTVEVED